MFASVPAGAKPRSREILRIMKDVNFINPNIKYQIRSGHEDLRLMVKIQYEGDYRHWKEISISEIDPLNAINDFVYETPDPSDPPNVTTPDEEGRFSENDIWMEVNGKRKRNSIEKLERKLRSRTEYPPATIAQIIANTLGPRRPNQGGSSQ